MYDMLKDQAELLKELNQLTRVEEVSSRDGKNGEGKNQKSGLFGFNTKEFSLTLKGSS